MTRCRGLWRWAPLVGLSLALQSCHKPPPLPEEAELARGDSVVVEASAGEFFEGRVLEIDNPRVKVQTLAGDDLREVGSGDVYRISGSDWREGPTSYGICKTDTARWEGCRITYAGNDRLSVVTLSGKAQELARRDVLLPSEVTDLNLKQRFSLAEARGRFEEQAQSAGAPQRPSAWRPAHRERVLARRGAHWAAARVEKEADAGVGVLWEDQGRVVRLPSNHVVPLPPYASQPEFAVDSFALMEPEAQGAEWTPVKIESVTDTEALVIDGDGKEHRAQLRKLVPLRR